MSRKFWSKIISVLLLLTIICSLFLPHFESLNDGMLDESISYLSKHPNPDQSGGLNGGGYYVTYNGFGSLNTIWNTVCSLIITLLIMTEKVTKQLLVYLFIFVIILFVLSIVEIFSAPFFLMETDSLKSGFYVLRILEVTLFYIAFTSVKNPDITEIK